MEHEIKPLYNSCLRCGRSLRSMQSAKRGYGAVCYKKAKQDPNLIDMLQPELEEQNFVDELHERKVIAG